MIPKKVNTLTLTDPDYPAVLKHLTQPPQVLYWQGASPHSWLGRPRVAVVGSRKLTPYGRIVTTQLTQDLAQGGVIIISGLALGVDSIAHQAALDSDGTTVAVLPTSLDNIYPASHLSLARQIVEQGGTLISEYDSMAEIHRTNFIIRNRIVSGLADVLLITEAAINSGTLHTARFALEQGKTVMVVPGNITSPSSEGCNNLIKSGAVPVTSSDDVLFALKIKPAKRRRVQYKASSPAEELILALINKGIESQEELAIASQLDGAAINSVLTMLEIAGAIRPQGAGRWLAV
jgi:DNA processing protein